MDGDFGVHVCSVRDPAGGLISVVVDAGIPVISPSAGLVELTCGEVFHVSVVEATKGEVDVSNAVHRVVRGGFFERRHSHQVGLGVVELIIGRSGAGDDLHFGGLS